MTGSWGHLCGPMPRAELLARARQAGTPHQNGQLWIKAWWSLSCGTKCTKPATHTTAYSYVTGRAGRTSQARKQKCPGCAANFCAKNGLAFEPATVTAEEIIAAYEANPLGLKWGDTRGGFAGGQVT